jgi:hypothetical protein
MAAATFEEFQQICERPPEATPDLFIPIKGENGLRLTKDQIETPVVHIAGTFDVPAAKAKAKAAAKQLEFALPIAFDLPINEEKFAGMLTWAVEREAARLRREGAVSIPATPELPAPFEPTADEPATVTKSETIPAYILNDAPSIAPGAQRAEPGRGIPFLVTQQMRAQLAAKGFTPEQIRHLTPQQAWEALGVAPRVEPPRQQARAGTPPPNNGSNNRRQKSTTDSPHGDEGAPQGEKRNTWVYDSLDQEMYLLVEKIFTSITGLTDAGIKASRAPMPSARFPTSCAP